jgi:hypothetical protein
MPRQSKPKPSKAKQSKPKQSKTQKKVMKDVMHEYKRSELKSGSGKKVKSRKQAIAIGLKEAGASKYAGKSENKRNLKNTLKKKRSTARPVARKKVSSHSAGRASAARKSTSSRSKRS